MKKLFLSALLLTSHFAFAAADDSAVANRKWVRELLEKSGVRVLNATTTKNLDGTTTYTSAYQSEENPDVASISLTFSPISVVSNGVFASAPTSLFSLFLPSAFAAGTEANNPPEVAFTLTGGSYLTKTIPAKEVEFNFGSGLVLTLQDGALNERISSDHTCFFEGKNCICVGARTEESVWEGEAEEFYPIVDAVEFAASYARLENWIDTATWEDQKTIGKNTLYLITDSLGKKHRMNDIAVSDAWIVGLLEAAKVINDWNKLCQDHYVLNRMCDKAPTPQHDWGDEVKISESATLVVYEKVCKRCGEKEITEIEKGKDPPPGFGCNGDRHVAKPFGCGCICGEYGETKPHPNTSFHHFPTTDCRCNCGHFHRAVASDLCPEVCAHCPRLARAGISAQIVDAPDKYHIPCEVSDGRCGCKCGMVTVATDDITFHVFADGDCQCLGTSGNGGRFHRHMPDANCKGVCANRNKWGIDGAHTVAPGTVDVRPTKAAVSDHTKTTSSSCGCKCGDYNHSNADEWKYAAAFHNSNPNDCGCLCEKGAENQVSGEFHKFPGANACRCYCLADGKEKGNGGKHRRIDGDGKCKKVCHGSNHGEGEVLGYYHASDEDGKLKHTPRGSACGCECAEFNATHYTAEDGAQAAKFHGGESAPEICRCECGAYHTPQAGNPCESVCNTCNRLNKKGFTANIQSAAKEDHTYSTTGEYCGCKCGAKTSPHVAKEGECYCCNKYSEEAKFVFAHRDEPFLIKHINLQPTGNVITNSEGCAQCDGTIYTLDHEYKCDNNHYEYSHSTYQTCDHTFPKCDRCDCCGDTSCDCPFCLNVAGAEDHCTCSGRDSSTDKSKFKITNPILTAPEFAELFAGVDRNEVVEIDGDDPVYEIADDAMSDACCNMPMLETVKFNLVTNMGNRAFWNAFTNCPNLKSVQFARLETLSGNNVFFRAFIGSQVKRLEFPRLRTIPVGTFYYAEVEEISLPMCTRIDNDSFSGCRVRKIYAPMLESIGAGAFERTTELSELTVPSLKLIRDVACFANSGLKTLSLPAVQSLDDIGFKDAFAGSRIQDLYLPSISTNAYDKAWADHVALPTGCTIHFSDGDVVYPGLTE